jgi:hypothetical protein
MTLEEAQQKLAELQEVQKANEATIAQLNTNIANQNSYITKLEAKAKGAPQAANAPSQFDPAFQAYLEKNMKRDALEEAKAKIKLSISDPMYAAVEPDFLEFLDRNLKKENCTVEYIVDAFSLVMGRALQNKDHAINKLQKQDPKPEPAAPATNSQVVQTVQQQILQTPPTMSNRDTGAASGMPATGTATANTRDAFKALKSKFSSMGGGRFN